MRFHLSIFLVMLIPILSECSNTRFLADDEVLYTGHEKVEIITKQKGQKTSSVKMDMKSVTGHKVNNAIFDRRMLPPIGLWIHNYWDVDEQKKIGSWLHKSLTATPVLISDVNPELRAQKIENDLFDQGYFQSRAWSVVDINTRNPKKARISYFVELSPATHYDQIEFDTVTESIDTLISWNYFRNQIKSGDQFNLDKLKAARDGLSRVIQDMGYFYYNPDFIELRADTTGGNYRMNLTVGEKRELPQSALSIYEIDNIHVYISRPSDTASVEIDTLLFDGISIVSSNEYLRPELLRDVIFFNKGDLYSYKLHQSTITRLNSLGVFSYARVSYEYSGADSLSQLLNVRIDLTMSDNIGVDYEADMVMKSTGYLGPALSAGISHGNAFKGAEKIHVKLNGGFEWQWATKQESQLGTFSYDFGVNSGITFPRIILPGKPGRLKTVRKQQTSINLDLSILNRTAYYKLFSAMTNYNYIWGKTMEIQHSYSPIYLNSVSLIETTPAFDSVIDENIYIRKSFEEQFIFGTRYEFTYDNTFKSKPHNCFFQTSVSTAGNCLDLFNSIGKNASERPYYFLGNIYSQHIKLTTDFRYYINGLNKTFVIRLYAGAGLPYRNSSVLPYVEQFFSGGAYSIRGFTARTLGPGSYYEEAESSYIDQSGDLKLEGNLEYRFGLSKMVNGAVFLEAGNIWLVNEDENRPGSRFDFNTFYQQLAVGTGVGLRFDFNFFVLRTDLGFPLRTPYVQDDRNWLFGTNEIWKSVLFYVAIGYPF